MNNHYSENEIEALARSILESPEKVDTHTHLSECAVCREKYEYMLTFYRALSEELEKPADLALMKLLGVLAGSDTVVLVPFRAKTSPENLGLTPGLTVLAAQEKSGPEERFTAVATFASDNPKTLLRVVEDKDVGIVTVYVLSEDSKMGKRNEIVAFDTRGHSIRMRTNDLGFVRMKPGQGIDWASARVAIVRQRSS